MRNVFYLSSIDLFLTQFCGLTSMCFNMLLKNQCVGIFLMANWTLVKHSHGWLGSVHPHVGLQVAFGGESATADATLKGSFTGMGTIVHLKGRLARQHSMANDAFIRICQLMFNVVDQGFQFRGLISSANLNQRFPSIVIAPRSG